ncbi:MAG TPA: AzlC family ABC transporter permease [Micromonosporaceae bacterium]|nr:AzlC family ABC transporter permease [Micromonosporaceae bacterium]
MISLTAYRHDVLAGARAMVPGIVATAPFGLVIGVTAAQSHLPTFAGWLTGPTIFAGSAQLTAIQMLNTGAAPAAVIATVLIINVRLMLYSAGMMPHWRGTPLWWRVLAGYLLVDPSYAVGIQRYEQPGDRRAAHVHYFGAAVALWLSWLAAIAAGATLGAGLPPALHLDFLVPLYLIGQVVPRLTQAAPRRAALTSAAVAALALTVPMHLGLAVGIVAGLAAGIVQVNRTEAGATAATKTLATKTLATKTPANRPLAKEIAK